MATNAEFKGVSKCYVFKSRLQEYAQKMGIKTPVYETTKEGPSHEPSFRSTVILNDVRYDSLLGFTNRKAAEQSAAEVALVELSKSGDAAQCISQPVHEIGLCKNLLQEYAQKMNYAVPVYQCQRDTSSSKVPLYSCTVEIGGIRYIGAAATTKKESEIKVARTALLALLLSDTESSMGSVGSSELTVLPSKRKRSECEEIANEPKPKKPPYKRRMFKKKAYEEKVGQTEVGNIAPGSESNESVKPMTAEARPKEPVSEDIPHANNVNAEHGPSIASDFTNSSIVSGNVGSISLSCGNITTLAKEVDMVSAVKPMTAEALPQDSVSEYITRANNVNAEHGLTTASDFTNSSNGSGDVGSVSLSCGNTTASGKEVNMVSSVKPMTAGTMPQDSVSEDIPHANNVNAEHGLSTASDFTNSSNGSGDVGSVSLPSGNITTLAKEADMVSAVKPMTAEAMPQDSVSEDIPHANNVNAEPSTASDFTNGSNGSWDVGSVSLSCGNTTTSAKEVNMVAAVKPVSAEMMPQDLVSEDIPHANNVNAEHGPSAASDFTNGSNLSGDVGSVSLSCGDTTTLAKEVNMVSSGPCLEASSVMPGPD
ncbi:putative GPI-anchored protein pfl2 isoform X1 [Rosa rugosa]|uniref:putative GPI-anchored protein pfl2 isoform X1 n=2 Tax=Rosa rugosa TaxID=74645 RepID=UPI002B408A41|nr:putative GPI-anchored protein pfl2 isoform X1 [Rosa rugosa]XP_062025979.1 putative GPI-anchored protein pfl2 isoform X1 [Rosa rugosa]XP_062025980.1 putative GPI-anchored protein pfl2 isoform X1 [Rosa rugosa]